jgi:hypothetical protein
MATRYYRMTSLLKAEAVLKRLASEAGIFPSRPLGYAHRYIVRVDYADGLRPDELVREVDLAARLVSRPTDRIDISTR